MSFEDILTSLGVEFRTGGHHHCRPGWLQLDCPFCGKGTSRFHLGWNLAYQYFHCWRCGGRNAVAVLVELGMHEKEAWAVLRDVGPERRRQREITRRELVLPSGKGPLGPAHRRYLRERGFDPEEVVSTWKVEGISIASRLSWRLFIPVHFRGEVVSWTTRALGDRVEQRYISAAAQEEKYPHKNVVYGLDYCRHSVVVVEGPIDAWAVGRGGGATFGTAVSSAQIRQLVEIPRRVICFDASPDAQRRAAELARQLAVFPGVTQNVVLDAKDPGCASRKEIKLLRKVARL